jgi:N-acetylmuramoyl-L-alanine amidase
MPAARIGDLCAHGGAVVGPGCPTVLIGNMIAVRAMPAMDTVACPMFDGVVPHATGTILKGSNTVLIGNMPAARVSDPVGPPANCKGNQIAMGCFTVLIGDSGGGGGGGAAGGGAGAAAAAGQSEAAQDESPTETSSEPTYADTPPREQPPGESPRNVGTGTHWIEIEMVDEAEQPVVGERYAIRLPDGKEVTGGLNAEGKVRLEGIEKPGNCGIKFPNLDLAAWERWRPGQGQVSTGGTAGAAGSGSAGTGGSSARGGSGGTGSASAGRGGSGGMGRAATPDQHQGGTDATGPAEAGPMPPEEQPFVETGPVPEGPPQRAGRWHRVLQGECISSLACDTGHFWETIWSHPANAELKRRRENPNVLLPRDAVFVPDNRPKEDSGPTDQNHKFRRKGEPTFLLVRLLRNGKPEVGLPFVLQIAGRQMTGRTNSDGLLKCPIPGNARSGHLIIGEALARREYSFILGHLDPIDSMRGIQERLNNLGYDCGPVSGVCTAKTRKAIERFQRSNGLPPCEHADGPTRRKVWELHQS